LVLPLRHGDELAQHVGLQQAQLLHRVPVYSDRREQEPQPRRASTRRTARTSSSGISRYAGVPAGSYGGRSDVDVAIPKSQSLTAQRPSTTRLFSDLMSRWMTQSASRSVGSGRGRRRKPSMLGPNNSMTRRSSSVAGSRTSSWKTKQICASLTVNRRSRTEPDLARGILAGPGQWRISRSSRTTPPRHVSSRGTTSSATAASGSVYCVVLPDGGAVAVKRLATELRVSCTS
jgi:hypothetical protein